MFHITQPIQASPLRTGSGINARQTHAAPKTQPAANQFGLATVSFGRQTPATSPVTPRPIKPASVGTRLDYYA